MQRGYWNKQVKQNRNMQLTYQISGAWQSLYQLSGAWQSLQTQPLLTSTQQTKLDSTIVVVVTAIEDHHTLLGTTSLQQSTITTSPPSISSEISRIKRQSSWLSALSSYDKIPIWFVTSQLYLSHGGWRDGEEEKRPPRYLIILPLQPIGLCSTPLRRRSSSIRGCHWYSLRKRWGAGKAHRSDCIRIRLPPRPRRHMWCPAAGFCLARHSDSHAVTGPPRGWPATWRLRRRHAIPPPSPGRPIN